MTDTQLRDHVVEALDWEPSVDAATIGVTTDDGIVTLHGVVTTFADQETADRVARHVYGVRSVANHLCVRPVTGGARNDGEIARAASDALTWAAGVPEDRITVSVRDGHLVLRGTVDWQVQKAAAASAVSSLAGVLGLRNDVVVEPRFTAEDVQKKIEAAFRRSADIDARRIKVNVEGHTVTLTGNVRSWSERQAAEQAAWAAPGIASVEDHLSVVP